MSQPSEGKLYVCHHCADNRAHSDLIQYDVTMLLQHRPSLGAKWGAELISGWGPFEFIDMCNAADIIPVMTTTGVCDACT